MLSDRAACLAQRHRPYRSGSSLPQGSVCLAHPGFENADHATLDWLSAVPGTFPPEEVAAVASSYSGDEALRVGFAHYRTLLEDGRVNRAWHETGGTLPMPVLAVGGEHSTGARLADSLNTVAPRLTGAVIPGSGHFVPEERPDAFARELLPFLSAPPQPPGHF